MFCIAKYFVSQTEDVVIIEEPRSSPDSKRPKTDLPESPPPLDNIVTTEAPDPYTYVILSSRAGNGAIIFSERTRRYREKTAMTTLI